MRVIIIGAGKVGYNIASALSKEMYDVIVIDNDEEVLKKVDDTLDVFTIHSNGLIGKSLSKIGVNKDDIVIAVTESDETNILLCLSAKHLEAGRTIARIRNPEYENDLSLPKEKLPIDFIINPEKTTAEEIVRLLTFSPAGMINEFGDGSVQMVQRNVQDDSPLNNKMLKEQNNQGKYLIAAIIRDGETIIPKGDHYIKTGDNIFVIGQKKEIAGYFSSIGEVPLEIKRVIILGGGRISYYLAEYMSKLGISTKIIEKDMERCKRLSEELPDTLIIHGDGTDLELLKSEGIATTDAFIALSGFDEENILATLLARQNGAKKGIAKVNRENYISLASNIGVDTTITPSLITTSKILGFIRRETVLSLSLLPGGEAEVIEFFIGPETRAVDIPLKELNLPEDTIITTIIRDNKVIIPHGQDVIKKYDRIIVITKAETAGLVREFLLGKERIRKNGFWTGFKNNRSSVNR